MSCVKSQSQEQCQGKKAGGCLMIDSVEIRGFKCFENLKITPLKRLNVIVGESASGKTSFLEALFLLAGANPEIYFRMRSWRGFSPQVQINSKVVYESIFRDLFHEFDQTKTTYLSCVDNKKGRRSLEIYYKSQDSFSLPFDDLEVNAFQIDPIIFKWQVGKAIYESTLELKDNSFKFRGSAPVAPVAYFNPLNSAGQQNATSFSSLSRQYKAHRLLSAIKGLFPSVEDVNLEIMGGETTLHVSTGLSQRLPIADLSGGINKFVSIALGIMANPGGAVIVDEIENGFYYKNLSDVWNSLVKLSEDDGVQLIVTTHSYEFLKAIAPSLESKEMSKQFQLMRLEKGDVQPEIKIFSGSLYHDAIVSDFEVR
jgi:AAA15 family ATPase/GTPase